MSTREPSPVRRRLLALALVLLVVLVAAAARTAHSRHTASVALPPSSPHVVLVGYQAGGADPGPVPTEGPPTGTQVGALSVGTGPSSSCAEAAWATISAGRTVRTVGSCTPTTLDDRPARWSVEHAAAAEQGATLGTLAGSTTGCVAAVGPGAALAAARPDGSLDRSESLPRFLATGAVDVCPLTLVDAGTDPGPVVRLLAGRPALTVLVAAVAGPPGARPVGVEPVYRLGPGPEGWLTSTSTRRPGIVTLADLHATLLQPGAAGADAALGDGAPFRVRHAAIGPSSQRTLLRRLDAVPAGIAVGAAALLAVALLAAGLLVAGRIRRRTRWQSIGTTALLVLPATAALTGAVPWSRSPAPGFALSLVVVLAVVLLTAVVRLLRTATGASPPVTAAALLLLVLGTDALTGGMLQEASLLNPRPLDGGRWYGFGNLTFACYACAVLVVLDRLLDRVRRTGHGAVLCVGFGAAGVLLDAWPGAGADLGGGLTLGVTATWLLLGLSARTARGWWRPLVALVVAVAAAGLLAWLDWLRGPTRWTHLGAFVQRLRDADAGSVVVGKASAMGASLVTAGGVLALLAGIVVWVLVLRSRRELARRLAGSDRLVGAVLATAVLGTLVNDSGVLVWAVTTGSFAVTVLALLAEPGPEEPAVAGWRRRRPPGLPAGGPAPRTTPGPARGGRSRSAA